MLRAHGWGSWAVGSPWTAGVRCCNSLTVERASGFLARACRDLSALPVLLGGGLLGELEQVAGDPGQGVADLSGGDVEELAAVVDAVDALVCEVVVEAGLHAYRVLGEEQGVDVEVEWNGGVAELLDPVHRLEAAGMPILTMRLPEEPMLEMT